MFDIVTEEKLFNEFIIPGVSAEIKARSKLFDRIKKVSKKTDMSGKYAKQKLLLAGSQATGARNDSSYPAPQESSIDEAIIRIKRAQMFSMKFDGFALEAAKGKGTPVDSFDFEQEGLFIQVSEDISRQLMLDGSGHLAQVNGAVAQGATTVVVDSPFYAKATKFLKANRVIDFYVAADTSADGSATSKKIASITDDTHFELAAGVVDVGGILDDDWIHGDKTWGGTTEVAAKGEMMGLDGIIRATDPPSPNAAAGLQGLLVATYPTWKSYVDDNSGTLRDLTEVMLIKALDEISYFGKPSVLLTTHGVRRFYGDLLTKYKGIYNQKVLWGGWSGVPVIYDGREIPMVPDKFTPDGSIYLVSEKNLTLYTITPGIITFEKGTAGRYLQKVAGHNEYVAEGHFFGNLGVNSRKPFGVIKDLNEK